MQVFTSAKSRRRVLLGILVLLAGLAGMYLALRRFAPFVFEPAEMRAWIRQFGVFAPLVFIVIQILQVIFAPVPGQAAALVGGYLFGPVAGTAYSMVGVVIGSAIAFTIARQYGRPAVERMIHEDLVEKFDGFVQTVGVPGLFLFVVIPGLPDDAICFLAGLAHFRLLVFVTVMAVGRFPAYAVTSFAGDGLATGPLVGAAVAVLGLVVFLVYAYHKREEIRRYASGM